MTSLKNIFSYIMLMTKKYNIDQSHGMRHSMDVIQFANQIFEDEILNPTNRFLIDQEKIIYMSVLLHDMCDNKYMNEKEGLENLKKFIATNDIDQLQLNKFTLRDVDEFTLRETDEITLRETDESKAITDIISTMSYSKVMKTGTPIFPDLGEYQLAYHIVRESDLLAAYDFDRCMIYQMENLNGNFDTAFCDAKKLFDNRVFKHFDNNLFITNKSKEIGQILHINALDRIKIWNNIVQKKTLT